MKIPPPPTVCFQTKVEIDVLTIPAARRKNDFYSAYFRQFSGFKSGNKTAFFQAFQK